MKKEGFVHDDATIELWKRHVETSGCPRWPFFFCAVRTATPNSHFLPILGPGGGDFVAMGLEQDPTVATKCVCVASSELWASVLGWACVRWQLTGCGIAGGPTPETRKGNRPGNFGISSGIFLRG